MHIQIDRKMMINRFVSHSDGTIERDSFVNFYPVPARPEHYVFDTWYDRWVALPPVRPISPQSVLDL